ncbi:MAG: methionyl-tRNA formyltransferase [Planctomycetes bacterium]|nr:methionyl-tRNA formyltransferase [Planctomycetota bacterium]
MTLRIAMLGTGSFALPTFQGLLDSRHSIVGLVTQPDRTGAGHHQHRNPLKELALARNLPVFQPVKASAPESLDVLAGWQADLFVVAAYGQILSSKLLSLPRLGAINVHASILPKHRGASPIQHAVWVGDVETGITIFQIVRELDAGPVLAIKRTPIGPDETSGALEERLATFAAPVLLEVVEQLDAGAVTPQSQDHSQATYARRLSKSDGEINWTRTATEIACHVRAMQPWPNAFSHWLRAAHPPLRVIVPRVSVIADTTATPCGLVLPSPAGQLLVKAGQDAVSLVSLQPEGKRAMTVADFLRGYPVQPGQRFGEG